MLPLGETFGVLPISAGQRDVNAARTVPDVDLAEVRGIVFHRHLGRGGTLPAATYCLSTREIFQEGTCDGRVVIAQIEKLYAASGDQPFFSGALKQLVEAKMLTPLRTRGAKDRINLYAEADINALEAARNEGISCTWFRAVCALPEVAIEQLVALGHLDFCRNPVASLLYGESRLRADTAEPVLERIIAVGRPRNSDGWISLTEAFMGVGGREKPWGPVLAAWLAGSLPGGLANKSAFAPPVLSIPAVVARSLVMGGPAASPWFSFELEHYGELRRDWFSPGETAAYLNCSAVEISFLIERGHLRPLPRQGRTRYGRSEVEEFARAWMNTREAATRLGVPPRHVWRELEPYCIRRTLGRGFHRRDELEPIVELEVKARRHDAMRPRSSLSALVA